MMSRFFNIARGAAGESGAYFPVAVLLLVALLAVGGLAVDGGNMFLTHLYLQRAVDSGVIAAMVNSSTADDPTLKATAERFIIANMQTSGIYHPTANGSRPASTIEVSVVAGHIVADATTPAQTLILNVVLPSVSDFEIVRARAEGGARQVAVVLVLDESGSMGGLQTCPLSSPCSQNGACTKSCLLKEAVRSFIGALDATDSIGIVGFSKYNRSSIKQPLVNCAELPGGFTCNDRADANPITGVDGVVSQLAADGGTCISCGLQLARQVFQLADPPLAPTVARYVVLMSDGAPTQSDNDLPPTNTNPSLSGTHHCGYAAVAGAGSRTCYYVSGSSTFEIYPQCVQRHAYAAIVQSDLLRAANIPVLGIGLADSGENWCMGPTQFPPYQACAERAEDPSLSENEVHFRTRPYLFRRLTNTVRLTDGSEGPADLPFVPLPPYLDNYDLNTRYDQCRPRYGPSFPPGKYIETPNANELEGIFRELFEVIKRPRLRQ